ncbi:metallophosphoesterase [Phaeobacter sp. B1627]|uniref:metallophosphoesterase n=1 Tax=Phaeobacter sp. B1627 TaxID=2583809 RepID=UPI00111805AA|nr:metallophosphoesterase [Phaeobacter sp. B1627]TNJ43022.1 metallophosphoesterase [Phaeobacter sp. B1627]
MQTCRTARSPLLPPVYDPFGELPDLPHELERWPVASAHSGSPGPDGIDQLKACLSRAEAHGGWRWPTRPVVFLSDTHADAEGFLRSLVVSGLIRRDRAAPGGFVLTAFGRSATILIGGDCLDKGPSNLDMLDALGALMAMGPDLRILAGNHDLRLRLAIGALQETPTALSEHLLVRMGRKIIPLLREVHDRYVSAADLAALPSEAECRARLHPRAGWAERFSVAAVQHLKSAAVALEIAKLERKAAQFDAEVLRAGLSARAVLAAALKCREVFFMPGGDYAWFYDAMDVVCQLGSLLFVHAGVDDSMCRLLAEGGAATVNRRYRSGQGQDPFAFYFGPLANLVRTKYRTSDAQLTRAGVADLHCMGVHMVVQGHVNNAKGQRLLAKRGLLHLEGDVTLDRSSRQGEGLSGIGAGATLIFPSGDVIGLSRDYPRAKHFAPERQFRIS